mgnify:CR=1 FL=1
MAAPAPDTQELPPSALRSTASAVKHSTKPASESRPKVEPVVAEKAAPEIKPDVKIAESPKEPSVSSPVSSSAVNSNKAAQSTTAHGAGKSLTTGVQIGYVVAATVISVLVGFLWYKFFSSLARIKD